MTGYMSGYPVCSGSTSAMAICMHILLLSQILLGFFGYTSWLVGGLCEDVVVDNWVKMLVAGWNRFVFCWEINQ